MKEAGEPAAEVAAAAAQDSLSPGLGDMVAVGKEAAGMAVVGKEVVDMVAVDKVLDGNQVAVPLDSHQEVDNQGAGRILDQEDKALVKQCSNPELPEGTVLQAAAVVHNMTEEGELAGRRAGEELEEEEEEDGQKHHTELRAADQGEDSPFRMKGIAAA
jgi:hypothetical protein